MPHAPGSRSNTSAGNTYLEELNPISHMALWELQGKASVLYVVPFSEAKHFV